MRLSVKHDLCICHQARISVFSICAHKNLYKITYRVQLFLKNYGSWLLQKFVFHGTLQCINTHWTLPSSRTNIHAHTTAESFYTFITQVVFSLQVSQSNFHIPVRSVICILHPSPTSPSMQNEEVLENTSTFMRSRIV